MGLLKDWKREHEGMYFRSKVPYFFSPSVWFRLHTYRKQRADRGWSDRDMWSMGEHLAQITVEMLKDLQTGMTDWENWFKYNINEEGKGAYKNLQQVIDDIQGYLEFEKTSWADDLTHAAGKTGKFSISWVDKDGKKLTEAAITHRLTKYNNELMKRYKKACKAMGFVGRNFAHFWD